jgi:hypothetical protein
MDLSDRQSCEPFKASRIRIVGVIYYHHTFGISC